VQGELHRIHNKAFAVAPPCPCQTLFIVLCVMIVWA